MEDIKLTMQETAKVFAMYLGCEFKYTRFIDSKLTVEGITRGWDITDIQGDVWKIAHSKLLLTPLSSISGEHAREVCRVEFKDDVDEDELDFDLIEWGKSAVLEKERIKHLDWDTHQYLISKGYAVPLYFSPNHPANGKNALELGIAIEASHLTFKEESI